MPDRILVNLEHNIHFLQQYSAECVENVVVSCHRKFEAPALSLHFAACKLYAQGWRNIQYDGYQSFTCPECLDSLKKNPDLFPNLKVEEY